MFRKKGRERKIVRYAAIVPTYMYEVVGVGIECFLLFSYAFESLKVNIFVSCWCEFELKGCRRRLRLR